MESPLIFPADQRVDTTCDVLSILFCSLVLLCIYPQGAGCLHLHEMFELQCIIWKWCQSHSPVLLFTYHAAIPISCPSNVQCPSSTMMFVCDEALQFICFMTYTNIVSVGLDNYIYYTSVITGLLSLRTLLETSPYLSQSRHLLTFP